MVTRDERLAAAETLTRLINGYQISRAVYVVTDLSVGNTGAMTVLGRREAGYPVEFRRTGSLRQRASYTFAPATNVSARSGSAVAPVGPQATISGTQDWPPSP